MTRKLEKALIDQKSITKPKNQQIAGWLGIPLGGQKRVEVIGRNSYVYVRLRSNQSEVIQAYNNKVAASYNLPVLVERDGNRYVVASVDTKRYDNNWNSQSPFLPIHGHTHSFDVEGGGGGDPVWVESRQFTPLLSLPSGSAGAGGVVIDSYLFEFQGSWRYVGGTGSPNISMHRPNSPTGAIMALVYLDAPSGNPQIIINSGTVFSNSITGSSQLAPYIPSLPSPTTQIPLAAIRLISGTNALSWDNIYDARQWLHVAASGSAGGLSSIAVQDEGVPQGNATTFNFVGSGVQATISGSVAQIDVSGGGGSINTGVLDQRYLKLDCSNDPLTHNLEIDVISNEENLTLKQTIPTGITSLSPAINIQRKTSGSASFLQHAITIFDDSTPGLQTGTWQAGTLYHRDFKGNVKVNINPYHSGTIVQFGSVLPIPSGTGRLLSFDNQGVEKFWADGVGNFGIPTGSGMYIGTTKWSHRMWLDFGIYTNFNPLTANNQQPYSTTIDRKVTFISYHQKVFVQTTNDSTNYWKVQLNRDSDGAVIAEVSTQGLPANTLKHLSTLIFSIASVEPPDDIYMYVKKINNPGSLYIFGPRVEVEV